MRTAPGVARFARARWAPKLIEIYVGPGASKELESKAEDLKRFGEVIPALGLPEGVDPTGLKWSGVADRHVHVRGNLPKLRLLRLMAAVVRDGADYVVGYQGGEIHEAVPHG